MKTEKRRKIMSAAERLFSSRRIHEVTMDEVAGLAGVGKGTLYRYFADKEDLFFEVALSGFDTLCEMVRAEGGGASDFRGRLIRISGRIAEFHESRRRLMHMMHDEERHALRVRGQMRDLWLTRRRELVAAMAKILDGGRREGLVRPDVPSDVLAILLLGLLRTRGREMRMDPGLKIEHETIVDVFLNGARGRKEG